MEILNPIDPSDLGMGIVLFKDVVPVKKFSYINYIEKLKNEAIKKDYTIIYNEDKKPLYAINRSGHRYSLDDINKSASHIMDFVSRETPKEIIELFSLCEEAMNEALLRYIEIFTLILPSIWWRTQGHILAYGPGSSMGLHSDNDVNYQPGFEPDLQLATRNVVGIIIYLNSSVDDEDLLQDNDYLGGEIEFVYAGVKYKPKAGDILMFPSNYLGSHMIHECTKGNRYAYIGYYCQGSADPDRGINIANTSVPIGSQGQIWMKELVDDYIDYIENKYKESSSKKNDLLIATKRKYNSSKTMKEVADAR